MMQVLQGHSAAPIEPLIGKTIAVLGYGNQGHAHALNLRDSGLKVIVGSRSASSAGRTRAADDGFKVFDLSSATQQADLVIVALPDEAQSDVYQSHIAPNLKPGATLGFIHGFSIRFELIKPDPRVGVVMIAPKGPGATLRQRFIEGLGLPCLYALHQQSPANDAEHIALAWANGLGCARAGIIRTTFADETDTDLFGEQSVLCGGMTWLILAAFETLVKAGYPPELAYLECCHEVKQIADLVHREGLAGMMNKISNTAEFGAHVAGPALIDHAARERLQAILGAVRDGSFARKLREDHARGFAWFEEQRHALREHPLEAAGRNVRALMPWLNQPPR